MLKYESRIRKSQSGFTLMEVLVTVAIIICLLALSIVAIPKYLKHLQITELDIAAREIYMAAQNEAILLKSSGELKSCVVKKDPTGLDLNEELNKMDHVEVNPLAEGSAQITAYFVHSSDLKADTAGTNVGKLLPVTSIEDELWDGDFYIVYEPISGSVIDVFYAEKDAALEGMVGSNFATFYKEWRAKPKETRMNHNPMIGYYGGESGESGTSISLRTPVINIYNEDTLRVEVTYWVPRTLSGTGGTNGGNVKLDVELEYEGISPITLGLTENDRMTGPIRGGDAEYAAYSYTWVLDSLEEGKQFRELLASQPGINNLEMGKDFTITASVSYEQEPSADGKAPVQQVNGARKSATDNSLFAKKSGGDTARIANMRHLQNLDEEFSGVGGKDAAVQIANVACGSEGNKNHKFIPIENSQLQSYEGDGFEIRDLNVVLSKVQSGTGTRDSAGLFGEVKNDTMTFSNIKLVNAKVNGTGGKYTGALVGNAKNSTIENCQVYWENTSAAKTNLRDVLGDSDKGINYMIQGGSGAAGGLAGAMAGGTISNSFAATTVNGDTAGGLVGSGGNLMIQQSYGDNYLTGKQAAGLIGTLSDDSTATITDAYAVGFIQSPTAVNATDPKAKAAGFCLGNGRVKSISAYSAMLFSEKADNYALNPNTAGSEYINTCYLYSTNINAGQDEKMKGMGKSYATLTNLDSENIKELYGEANQFVKKDVLNTNPYNLQTTLLLTSYSYPGLKGAPHYGDWGAEFQSGSLVYYERYEKDGAINYAFDGGNLEMIKDDQYAVEDGYALAFRSNLSGQVGLTVEVEYYNDEGVKTKETLTYKDDANVKLPELPMHKVPYTDANGKKEDYYLLPLPGDMSGKIANIVNTGYADKDFYQELTFSLGNDENKIEGHYYYNPHFANAVVKYEDIESDQLWQLVKEKGAEIRTARHLYMLSKHSEYYASTHQYDFVQEMNINYSIYAGYDLFKPVAEGSDIRIGRQKPIGEDKAKPFRGTYDGKCHTIENVGIDAEGRDYVGLFGYSIGTIENATYFVNEKTVGTISSERKLGDTGNTYVGGLVGYNGGNIDNCAVAGMEIDTYAYNFSEVYAGGLVGWNKGIVQNCSAALTHLYLETNLSDGYMGGFVGWNDTGAIIRRCYAVGRLNAKKSEAKAGEVIICGFGGKNSGSIRQCYTATDLERSGDIEIYGFCADDPGNGAKGSNFYMNEGNFRYDQINYTAQYQDEHAQWKKYGVFKNADPVEGIYDELSMSQPGDTTVFSKDSPQNPDIYPYPGTVKDAEDKYIHYGMWPEMMDLNQGGIYYWEKMVGEDAAGSQEGSYHISAIILDLDNNKVEKVDTLSTKHNEGSIVTEYGYGYFTASGIEQSTLASSKAVAYSDGGKVIAEQSDWKENDDCNKFLSKLMAGDGKDYTFHSYNTWGTKAEQTGLYLTGITDAYGTWTLTLTDKTETDVKTKVAEFLINPFFADSMSLEKAEGCEVDENVPQKEPGSEEKTPFYVRSVDQLQFINWNGSTQNTSTVLDKDNNIQFPFLSYSYSSWPLIGVPRSYYWKQSHDLQGRGKTYTPIAELYDTTLGQEATTGTLYGWFGGTYDGDDYVIQDVNIEGTISSCAGLFGMVYDGTLKNIIMYSPTGDGRITAGRSWTTPDKGSAWYAIGGLAGFAATSSENSAIENCSIAGYTIEDRHEGVGKGNWGGTCMGGLVGVSYMALKNCTAVTKVVSGVNDNDNVRIGGLVGSCQKSISNCYAGGEIDVRNAVTKSTHGIYVGGIVGGTYFKPLKAPYWKQIGDKDVLTNTIRNCYSYVTLPGVSTNSHIKALFAIGGPGEVWGQKYHHVNTWDPIQDRGYTTYDNCYYLKNVTWRNNGGNAPTGDVRCDVMLQRVEREGKVTYEPAWPEEKAKTPNANVTDMTYAEMCGYTENLEDALLNKLNKNIEDENEWFKPVTTTTTAGNSINGKYSFTSDPSLVGQNYPFPTILTQNDDGVVVSVHYGAWPVEGLTRQSGSVPIDIDLFANYDPGNKGAVKTEKIMLSSLIKTGGTLSFTVKDENGVVQGDDTKWPVKIDLDENGFNSAYETELKLTGKKVGMAQIEVKYIDPDGNTYTIPVDVQVTAELQLQPLNSPVKLFTSETAVVALQVKNRNGDLIEGDLLKDITIKMVDTPADPVEWDHAYLEAASLTVPEVSVNQGDKGILLNMTSLTTKGESKVTLNYKYEYLGETYPGTNPVTLEIEVPTIKMKADPINIYFDDAPIPTVVKKTYTVDELGLTVDDKSTEKVKIVEATSTNSGLVFASFDKDKGDTLTLEAHNENLTVETSTYIKLKLQFELNGVTHVIPYNLQVNVSPGSKPEAGTP